MTAPRTKHQWTPEADAYIVEARKNGIIFRQLAKHFGVSLSMVVLRATALGLKPTDPRDDQPRAARWGCDFCGTRSDAAIEFGCGQCRPVRRKMAA